MVGAPGWTEAGVGSGGSCTPLPTIGAGRTVTTRQPFSRHSGTPQAHTESGGDYRRAEAASSSAALHGLRHVRALTVQLRLATRRGGSAAAARSARVRNRGSGSFESRSGLYGRMAPITRSTVALRARKNTAARPGCSPIRHVFADQGFAGRLVDWAADRLHTTVDIVRQTGRTARLRRTSEAVDRGTQPGQAHRPPAPRRRRGTQHDQSTSAHATAPTARRPRLPIRWSNPPAGIRQRYSLRVDRPLSI